MEKPRGKPEQVREKLKNLQTMEKKVKP